MPITVAVAHHRNDIFQWIFDTAVVGDEEQLAALAIAFDAAFHSNNFSLLATIVESQAE
jgi:hypothetical protein